MKKYRGLLITAIAIVLLTASVLSVLALAPEDSSAIVWLTSNKTMEKLISAIRSHGDGRGGSNGVAAVFRGEEILDETVDKMLAGYDSGMADMNGNTHKSYSRKDIIKLIVTNILAVEEAKAKGFTVTEDDVNKAVEALQKDYNDFPEGKKFNDDFCEASGITIDEYWNDIRQMTPSRMAKGWLKQNFMDDYYEKRGNTASTQEELLEANDAYKEYLAELLEKHVGEIEYK